MDHLDDLQEELTDAPFLSSLKKKGPFEAPEGYFEDLSGRFMDQLDDMEVLEEAPQLTAAGKGNIFLTPEHYFRDLPDRIMAKLPGSTANIKTLNSSIRPWHALAVAAAVALLLVVFIRPNYVSVQQEGLNALANLNEEEINEVLDLAGIDEDDLLASMDEEEVADFEQFINEDFFEGVSEDQLLEELDLAPEDLEDFFDL